MDSKWNAGYLSVDQTQRSTLMPLVLPQVTSSLPIPSSTSMSCCWTCGTRRTASRSTPTTRRPLAPGRWRCPTTCATTTTARCWTGLSLTPGERRTPDRQTGGNGVGFGPNHHGPPPQSHTSANLRHLRGHRVADRRHGPGSSGHVRGGATHHHHAAVAGIWREWRRWVSAVAWVQFFTGTVAVQSNRWCDYKYRTLEGSESHTMQCSYRAALKLYQILSFIMNYYI